MGDGQIDKRWLNKENAALFETYSNSISKVKQGGDERATKTVHTYGLGASDLLAGSCPLRSDSVVGGEANAVSLMKWNWNYGDIAQVVRAQHS